MSEANPDVGGGTQIRRIVVGVDGSEPSIRALQWAARQAEWSGATLEVLTAWTFPEHPAPLGIVVRVPWPEELMAEAAPQTRRGDQRCPPGLRPSARPRPSDQRERSPGVARCRQ